MNGRRERPNVAITAVNAEKILAVPIPSPQTLHHTAAPGAYVDATGTKRRLRALVAFGYSRTRLAGLLNIRSHTGIDTLFDEDVLHVKAKTAVAVEKLFNELQFRPPTNNAGGSLTSARKEGVLKGWALPFEWDDDDIDSPDASPVLSPDVPQPLTFRERAEELRYLGFGDREIAERLGLKLSYLERYCRPKKGAA
jgi:hypothetical protein